jgi:hypothetical protein
MSENESKLLRQQISSLLAKKIDLDAWEPNRIVFISFNQQDLLSLIHLPLINHG